MDILRPPTDNLYKFIAVFGLVIFIASIGARYLAGERLSAEMAGVNKTIEEIKLHDQEFGRLMAEWERVIKAPPEPGDNLTEAQRQAVGRKADELRRMLIQIQEKNDQTKAGLIELDYAMNIVDARAKTLLGVLWWSDLGAFTGLACIVLGFVLWYFKLQRYQDMIVKNQAVSPSDTKPDENPATTEQETTPRED